MVKENLNETYPGFTNTVFTKTVTKNNTLEILSAPQLDFRIKGLVIKIY